MKDTRLKNVIFTAGMAVFTGVLLLGVNAAIGAATPTVDPPGAGVSPTFTGVVITGISDLQGNLLNSAGNVSVSDNLAVTGNVTSTANISATGNLGANGNVSAGGSAIIAGNADIAGNAGIAGDAIISGDLLVSGALSADSLITPNISNADSNTVVISDGLAVNGPGASRIDGSFINVNAVLRANESIINDGDDPVLINDNFVVSGTFEATDLVNIGNNVMIQNDSDITVTGDADIHGAIKNTTLIPSAGPIAVLLPMPVTIDDNLVVSGVSTFNSDLTVTGRAKASRFGTHSLVPGSYVSVSGTGCSPSNCQVATASVSCPAGDILISCQGRGSNLDSSYSWTQWVKLNAIYSSGSTCYAIGRNENSSTRYVQALAICQSPNS